MADMLDLTNKEKPRVILLYSIAMNILETIYFATNFMGLSGLEPKLWPFIANGSHFGGHLGFDH